MAWLRRFAVFASALRLFVWRARRKKQAKGGDNHLFVCLFFFFFLEGGILRVHLQRRDSAERGQGKKPIWPAMGDCVAMLGGSCHLADGRGRLCTLKFALLLACFLI